MEYKFATTEELLEFLSEELLSAAEAAEVLDISKVRLGKLVKDDKLIAVKEQPKMFLKSMVLEKKMNSNHFVKNIDRMMSKLKKRLCPQWIESLMLWVFCIFQIFRRFYFCTLFISGTEETFF